MRGEAARWFARGDGKAGLLATVIRSLFLVFLHYKVDDTRCDAVSVVAAWTARVSRQGRAVLGGPSLRNCAPSIVNPPAKKCRSSDFSSRFSSHAYPPVPRRRAVAPGISRI